MSLYSKRDFSLQEISLLLEIANFIVHTMKTVRYTFFLKFINERRAYRMQSEQLYNLFEFSLL